MADRNTRFMSQSQTAATRVDEGLRQYMLRVYNYMSGGLALTGLLAYAVAHTEALRQIVFGSGLHWLFILSPLAIVLVMSFGINRIKASTAQALFWAFSGLMGVSLSSIFLVYTDMSIAKVFFITAGAFAGLSLYGYTTKRDLSAMGSFLIIGVIGLIIAMVVNWFLQSPAMAFVISIIGVLIFAGLTAYDTQKIKDMYRGGEAAEITTKKSVMGALRLYLDFINMFLFLLQLFGNRE